MFLARLKIYKRLTQKRSITFANYISKLLPPYSHMLDYGCGNMFTAVQLVRMNPTLKVTGVDVIRDQNLENNILNNKNIDFKLITATELPFPDNTFDVVLALAVMHHTPEPEYYLSELKRVIKAAGCIILIEEMYINFLDKLYISGEDWLLNKMKEGVPVPLNFRSNKHYKQEFQRQRLKIDLEDSIRAFPTYMHHYVYKLMK